MTQVLDRPLTKDEALTRLKALEPQLRALGVLSLYLFGSTVRNEARADSDVDLFGDLDAQKTRGLAYFGLRGVISDLLGRKVDFIGRDNLHPMLKTDIEASGVRVY